MTRNTCFNTRPQHLSLATVLLIGLSLISVPTAHADSITLISERTEVYPPSPSQDLRIVFQEQKKKVDLTGIPANQSNYLTDIRFAYDAGSPSKIEEYAVVQWIRGCMFHSEARKGRVTKTLSIWRNHFGQNVPFQHRVWEVDTDSADPIYTNYETFGRHALLRWNQNPNSLDAETSKYYGQVKPPHGSVFATDLPGSGFLTSGSGLKEGTAQNASLEFRTCLFKTADLPQTTDKPGSNIDQSKALRCVSWSHRFVWDFARGRMATPAKADAFCNVTETQSTAK